MNGFCLAMYDVTRYTLGAPAQKEQYDNTPKVPLIIGLSALLLVILTIVWLVVYRKIRRRQRRRTIGVFFGLIVDILSKIQFRHFVLISEVGDGSPVR